VTISLINSLGEELRLPTKAAREFFACPKGINKIMCLPCAEKMEIHGEKVVSKIYEIKDVKRKKKMKGTLVIRMGGHGDLIMLSSGLRELIKRGEQLTIATLPENVPFVKALDIGQVISIEDIGRYTYELVRDLRFTVEPKEMGNLCKSDWATYTTEDRSDAFDKLLGVFPARKSFKIPATAGPPTALAAKLNYKKGFILVNGAIGAASRTITPKHVEPLCKKLIKATGLGVVLIGAVQPWNKDLLQLQMPGLMNLLNKTNTEEMIDLCRMADVIVTPDTGTLHIAAALGKKTLALFGNINPRTRISYYTTVRTLYPQGELSCVPCWDMHPCMDRPEHGSKCMKLLTPARVANAVQEMIGG
jgi:ADP-heptose:LPS heptosyltransferase